jgi:micrococcal nuclease
MDSICQGFMYCCIYIQWSTMHCCCQSQTQDQSLDQSKNQNQNQSQYLSPIMWNDSVPFVPPIHQGQVIKVYDGDTITIAAKLPYPESPLYRFQVRLLGIDSPEIKGETQEEKDAAHLSQKELESLILQKIVTLKDNKQEKYGRILANVYIDFPTAENPKNQIHLNQWMLDKGYAVPYDGKTKTPFSTFHKGETESTS